MYPPSVEYIRATSLEHATALLEEHGHRAHLLAGGQSLVPLLKFRLAVPEVIIDISQIPVDEPISEYDDRISGDALATHDTFHSAEALTRFDVLQDAIPQLADPQVRNLGTIGGSLAEADPSGDWGPLLFLLDGDIELLSQTGSRTVSPSGFFQGPFQTALSRQEIISSVTIPVPSCSHGGAYLKLKQRQGVYATASVGVHVELNRDYTCRALRITASAIQSTYALIDYTEQVSDQELTNERVGDIAAVFAESLEPVGDTRGSVSFKRNLCQRLCERAVRAADKRARGEVVTPNLMEAA